METITEKEALSCLKILAAVARADGTVHNDERKSLAAALDNLELPPGTTVDALLKENVDVETELANITSSEGREQLYRSAYFMAYADGACTKEEQAILDKIAELTGVSDGQRNSLAGLFTPVPAEHPSLAAGFLTVQAVADPTERATAVRNHTLKYSVLTAVLGAFPIPGVAIATDLGVIALQLKMVRDIGAIWGQKVDSKRARSMLLSLGIGTGARLAIANLAKLVPVWGSAIGATTSFASSWALGQVIDKFFASGAENVEALKDDFEAAKKEGKKVYTEQQDVIVESQRNAAPQLDALAADLKAGKITQAEFDERVAKLA